MDNVVVFKDGVDTVLFDTRIAREGWPVGLPLEFFAGRCIGIDAPEGILSPDLTNLVLPGTLPKGQLFEFDIIRVTGIPYAFYQETTIELRVDNRTYEAGPLDLICGRTLKIQRRIAHDRQLQVLVTGYNSNLFTEPRRIRVELHGMKYRPVV